MRTIVLDLVRTITKIKHMNNVARITASETAVSISFDRANRVARVTVDGTVVHTTAAAKAGELHTVLDAARAWANRNGYASKAYAYGFNLALSTSDRPASWYDYALNVFGSAAMGAAFGLTTEQVESCGDAWNQAGNDLQNGADDALAALKA